MVDQNSIKIARQFAQEVSQIFADEIKLIKLFGSRASGTEKQGSDYDILIVLKTKDPQIIDGLYDIVLDFLMRYEVDISLHIYSYHDFQQRLKSGTPFMKKVVKTGIAL